MNFRIGLILATSLVTVFVAACSTSPTGRKQFVLGSDQALAQDAKRQFQRMRREVPLVEDRATIDYVACIAEAIVAQLEGEEADRDWELAIFEDATVNAFVMPGGKMAVFSGLLDVAQTPDQLAAVVGHEVAHETARHPNERVTRMRVTSLGARAVANTAIAGAGSMTAARGYAQAIGMAAQLGVLLPFTREQESEADIIGLEYMARAGFDPRASVQLWKNMQGSKGSEPPEFLSTHPSSETRINHLVDHYPVALRLYNEAKAEGRNPDCQAPARPQFEEADGAVADDDE